MARRPGPLAALAASLVVAVALLAPATRAFYIPALLPVDYTVGMPVDLWYNKVYSEKTQLPFEYIRLPVCRPAEDERVVRENLGEILRGDRFIKAPHQIKFGENIPCTTVCEPVKATKAEALWLSSLIANDYKVEWYLDGLPAATPYRTTSSGKKLYEPGFRLGTVETVPDPKNPGKSKQITYLNNHVSIAILYNNDDATFDGTSRIVGFEVYPRSISSEGRTGCPAEFKDTMPPQEISGNADSITIVYTYSVEFREDKEVVWGTRWDRFLVNSDPNIHWYSIINSLIILLFLSGMVAVIMLRTLYNDIAVYNDDESKEDQDEVTGWKLVHGDVFRPPKRGWLLAVMVGTGVQFLGAVLTTILFATIGVLNPSYRGGMASFAVFLFVFMGAFGGYYSARIYKAFRGVRWHWNALMTALIFPGIIFALMFVVNLFVWSQRSSSAIPFGTFVAIIALWFGVSMPLVFVGAYFGQKKKAIEHPVRTNQIPRQIPEINWFLTPTVSVLVGGLLPFAAVFIELFFIMKSVWLDQYYYMYGFLAIVFIILLITCVEITIVIIYFTLCSEDYHWWWRAFFVSSSSSIYVFLYGLYYLVARLHIRQFVPVMVYLATLFDACLIFFLCTGTVGFLSCYYFVIKIYGAVKVD